MNLEAATVCMGYGDLLAVTAPRIKHLFDRWVIVTEESDEETREVCRRHNLPTLLTEDHRREGGFNKGRAIQRGMDQLALTGWFLHLDSDILLPPDLRTWLDRADLDPACLYGCDRVMVRSWAEWARLRDSGYLQSDYHCRVNFPDGYPVGTRWASPLYSYVPIGFFQLAWGPHLQHRGVWQRPYPDRHADAARSDVQFALQWDRRQRVLLPDVIAIHLDSEPSGLGANWKGRMTRRFGPAAGAAPEPSTY